MSTIKLIQGAVPGGAVIAPLIRLLMSDFASSETFSTHALAFARPG